jgi:Rieske 2Fe-2S family protein
MAPGSPLDPGALERVLRLLPDAFPLPPEAFIDPVVLSWELERFFEASWVCVGREENAPRPGDGFTTTVGSESLLMVRGEDQRLRGFFNVCQHRGTRLVTEAECSGLDRIICPYHAWTYDLEGRLRASQHMATARDFDRTEHGLPRVATDVLDGWVFVNVSGNTGTLLEYLRDFPGRIARFDGGALRRVALKEYEVAANWKLLSENYQECYHCPTIHPELSRVTPYRSGQDEESHGPWVGGPMDLADGCTTMSLTGRTDRSPIPGLRESDHRHVFYYTVLPNLWISLHPDYVLTHTLWPIAVDRTRIVCEWLFHPHAMAEEGFDPSDAVEFWDLVNGQDFRACERVQLGIGSRGFGGGRFSEEESTTHWLASLLARSYLEGRIVRGDDRRIEDPAPAVSPAVARLD